MTDGAACIAYGEGLRFARPGVPALFTIKARDSEQHDRVAGGDTFVGMRYYFASFILSVTIRGGPASPFVTIQDNSDGSYSVSYVPTVSGTYTVHVSLRTVPIEGSPWEVNCSHRTF